MMFIRRAGTKSLAGQLLGGPRPDGCNTLQEAYVFRGLLLWMIGIPLPIVIILYFLFMR